MNSKKKGDPPREKTKEEVLAEIVDKSGHRLLGNVNKFLLGEGWTTRLSQYFMDATTDKAREIDLMAEKVFEFGDQYRRNWIHVHVKLCIECKYIKDPVVFWLDRPDTPALERWIDTRAPFKMSNTYYRHLHYTTHDLVAKLFSSGKIEGDTEPVFRALNQCIHGFVNTRYKSLPLRNKPQRSASTTYSLLYPVIVWSTLDNFYFTSVDGSPPPTGVSDNFLFEMNYAYKNSNGSDVSEYFLVDMVSYDKLPLLLAMLDREVAAVKMIG